MIVIAFSYDTLLIGEFALFPERSCYSYRPYNANPPQHERYGGFKRPNYNLPSEIF